MVWCTFKRGHKVSGCWKHEKASYESVVALQHNQFLCARTLNSFVVHQIYDYSAATFVRLPSTALSAQEKV